MEEFEKRIADIEKRIADPKTPQGEVRELNWKLIDLNRQLKIAEREKYEKSGLSVYGSDDYVGCSAGVYSFYFGYEVTKCPVKSHKDDDDCSEKDCEKREWCFTADKNGKNVVTWAESEFSYGEAVDIERKLILGMAKFIKEELS